MELLCIFAALAVLFLFCAFLTLKCNLHAALAPLSALGIAVAWLTAAGMANLLLPGTVLLWAVFAGSGVWALVPHKGQRPAYRRLVTPGAVLFWGMALAFAVYFFIRQPLATKYDELSLWATAVKVTKADNRLYALATLGTPWPQTQNPGLPLLSYFFQFLGHYADWKIYVAYDVLAAAVFAAVLGGLNFRQYRIAVPLAAICWFAPWFLAVYNHTIYLDTTYMTAYGDVPAGLALGGAVALWLALRKTGGPKWAVLPVLALAANIKANTFVLSLVAAGLMWYNAARFGSVFDFGANYNLTSNDMTRRGFAVGRIAPAVVTFLLGIPGVQTVFPYLSATKMQTNYMGLTITELYYGGAFACLPLLWGLGCLPLARRRLDRCRDLRAVFHLTAICTVVLAVLDCQMAGMLYRYQSDWLGPLLLAAALAWLLAERTLQGRGLPVLTKALRTVFPLAVLAGICYNFCVYFAAEPQMMGQNPALYENVSRLVQFWL